MTTSDVQSDLRTTYYEQGFVVLRGLFDQEEVTQWHQESDRILSLDLIDPQNTRSPYRFGSTETPERVDPVVDISELFHGLVHDDRLLNPVREIFGEEPLLFKDKLIFKMPGVEGYKMHQDWAWGWQNLCPADQILSVSIQLDGANAANGCIELFPDAHHRLITPAGKEMNFREEDVVQLDLSTGQKIETQPGDILIFHSLAPHRSGKNTSTLSRRSLYLTYNATSVGDLRQAYYDSRREQPVEAGFYFQ